MIVIAAKELTGEMIFPIMENKEYRATEDGEKLGILFVRVEKIANQYGIKAKQPGQNEYGRWAIGKVKHVNKEVAQWLYFDKCLKFIKQHIN